jgi:N-acetylglucosamine malate deacetylase 1
LDDAEVVERPGKLSREVSHRALFFDVPPHRKRVQSRWMNPFRQLVQHHQDALATPLPPFKSAPFMPQQDGIHPAPLALIFSPHPDDECIMGALPLHLQRHQGWKILNIAVTLGSNPARRAARRTELNAACQVLGWDHIVLDWEHVRPEHRLERPDAWKAQIHHLSGLLQDHRPKAIFYPHALDGHPVHQGVHHLVEDALAQITEASRPMCIQSEYWHPMEHPNLLVECPPDDLAVLIEALACHEGEVARNPYHRRLPAWMMDNVRRGAERVHGAGSVCPAFPFGALYLASPPMPREWLAPTTATPP